MSSIKNLNKKQHEESDDDNPYGVESSDDEGNESEGDAPDADVNVDFDVFPIEKDDGPFIRGFFSGLLGVPLEVHELAESLVTQDPCPGSVVVVDEDILGICSVLNLHQFESLGAVKHIRSFVMEHAPAEMKSRFESAFMDQQHPLGLLLMGRPLNMPVQIADPLWSSLWTEIVEAGTKHKQSKFSHFLLFAPAIQSLGEQQELPADAHDIEEQDDESDEGGQGKRRRSGGRGGRKRLQQRAETTEGELEYVREEDAVFAQHAEVTFQVNVVRDEARQQTMAGVVREFRIVMLISASKMDTIMSEISTLIATAAGGPATMSKS